MCNQPMDVLPSKVLSLVFLWGLPNSKYRFKVDRYRRCISQVCRSWRTICLDTPCLWHVVYIIINNDLLPHHNWLIMEPLIRRAGMVPLDLTIEIYSDSSAILHLLRCLKPHIDWLHELYFTSKWLSPILEFFPLPCSMPYLKTLDIHLIAWGSLASVELWDCNSSFPALESLTIDEGTCFAIRFSWTFQSISCDQVLDLNIIKLTACRDWGFGIHQRLEALVVTGIASAFSWDRGVKLSTSIPPGISFPQTQLDHGCCT